MAAVREPGNERGLGRYARALQEARRDIPKYDFVEYPGRPGPHGRFSEWFEIPYRSRFVAAQGPYFHATSAYHLDPTHLSTSVVSILDVIPLELGDYRQTGVKARVFFAWARRCPVILTLSEYSATRIVKLLRVPRGRIVVAPVPVTSGFEGSPRCHACPELPPRVGEYAASLIDATTVDPRKRLPWILGAAHYLRRRGVHVVLVGSGTEHIDVPNVVGMGRLCDYHTRRVLARAQCFLYATAYEGQGLPPQEALREGTPVVAFRNTSLPEMIGPGAVWLDEPAGSWEALARTARTDPQAAALADAAFSLCSDRALQNSLAAAGYEHVLTFTPGRFVSEIGGAYDMLTQLSPR